MLDAATRRSPLGLVVAVAAFLLLVAFSTDLSVGFWTVRAAVLLVIGAVGLPAPGRGAAGCRPRRAAGRGRTGAGPPPGPDGGHRRTGLPRLGRAVDGVRHPPGA